MGSSKKSKDKDREHKKKKKHRSSRSKSRERKERKDVNRSRSRSRERKDRKETARSRSRSRERKDRKDTARSRSRSRERKQRKISDTMQIKEEKVLVQEDLKKEKEVLVEDVKVENEPQVGEVPEEKESLKDDIHQPAVNIAEVKKTALIREKMLAAKEKRKVNAKLGKVKTLADSDGEDDSASSWVRKQKKRDMEKKRAEERAKLLDQMDEEFGISSLVEKEMKPTGPSYTSRDLKGLKVAHDQAMFKEGATTILTLADKGVLDEDGDELMNVNIHDLERTEKNLANKKAKPSYNPYDMEEDEYGMLKPKDVLSKYDEEISGPKKGEFFELGGKGTYDAAHEKKMQEIRNQLHRGAQTLELPKPSTQSEFYTQSEMEVKFKKRKKKVRKVKRSEMVKADDLLPLDDDGAAGEENNIPVFSSEITTHLQQIAHQPGTEVEDYTGGDVNLDDDVQDDYHSSLALARKLKQAQKMEPKLAAEKLLSTVGREMGRDDNSMQTEEALTDDKVTLTATDEFCRNLGSIPTYGQSGNRMERLDELMDFEQELMEQSISAPPDAEKGGWERVEIQEERPVDLDNLGVFQDTSVFQEEVLLDGGIASALKHATSKGFVDSKVEKHGGVTVKDTSSLLAKNYSIEDKKHDDIDEKFKKRGRHERYQGPLQDFVEKPYVPDFNLTYQDEQGRDLTQKEAFRILSHKFHGKGSGKKKTEKRLKKLDEDHMMMTMNSTDTPLNTVARLKEKQAKEQSAYIVLSGGNKTLTGNSVVK